MSVGLVLKYPSFSHTLDIFQEDSLVTLGFILLELGVTMLQPLWSALSVV